MNNNMIMRWNGTERFRAVCEHPQRNSSERFGAVWSYYSPITVQPCAKNLNSSERFGAISKPTSVRDGQPMARSGSKRLLQAMKNLSKKRLGAISSGF